ncbi:hypothetical protein [Paenibacillus eucommiae]|uniref:YhfH family protein n=1 Tax=Paenibacillus eucommiae TaxID=1355755 RepID=A0ABS4IS76_9BACL|nr:hypothetical protein [Paenibacillus eucommiae]MBP1989980.1 hypothetical protein [Paenibacillus eucommiae]
MASERNSHSEGFKAKKKDPDELNDGDLEQVAGGLASILVPLCKQCGQRVAVFHMDICAVCFRKLNPGDLAPEH